MEWWDVLGVKAGAVVAGFVGGVVSLSLIRNLTPLSAVGTVLGGTACAAYLTPIVLEYTGLNGSMEHALAFLLGIVGMNGVAGVFKISERFKSQPIDTITTLRGGRDGDDN
jgi:hypothetical protein